MTRTTLIERIANAEAKIEKKTNTIAKKEALILKKEDLMTKTADENEQMWIGFDIEHLKEDIEKLHKDIDEATQKLDEYKALLVGADEEEQILNDLPESLKRMQTELVTSWDAYDIRRRAFLDEEKKNLGYIGFFKKYNRIDYELIYKSDEQIHNSNMNDARYLILNLVRRVKDITGEITSWRGIRATIGTWGGTVLNGYVEGEKGRAIVDSIYAGGYNIQRLHVRVLVKKFAK